LTCTANANAVFPARASRNCCKKSGMTHL